MNTAALKKYAPKARLAFMAAVRARAEKLGLNPKQPAQVQESGQVYLINGQPHEARVGKQRETLLQRIEQQGYEPFIESLAYTWFNRFAAIRYMELHGFLDHGYRVLSHPSGGAQPEIMEQVQHLELPGLEKQKALELKLDGTQDEALYRELLLAQCHALHEAMPFLFEALDDATELLLPDNLTRTDSVIRELVTSIPETDWEDVEIIGWLYQFYISEKKDQVIGKVVKSADIPAATQMFTPNWIVQYLVQNSLGRLWLQSHPNSPVQQAMPYYVPPGEQPAEVQAQIAAHTPESLNPEHIKVLDPACGSGHILVEAYKLLKQLYEERGYRNRDIPQLILKHNLFGLDIDDRAGQLAGFSLMMLARADDRRVFERIADGEVTLNIVALQESSHLDLNGLWRALNLGESWQQGTSQNLFEDSKVDLSTSNADSRYRLLSQTLVRFSKAKTFGSLIEVPKEELEPLADLKNDLENLVKRGDLMQRPAAIQLLPYVNQAWILALRYDAVVANPPYMGSKGMNTQLKIFSKSHYSSSKSDLFAIFMERGFELLNDFGFNAMVTMHSWMFLSSFMDMRSSILNKHSLWSLIQLPYDGRGPTAMGLNFGLSVVVLNKAHIEGLTAYFDCFRYYELRPSGIPMSFPSRNERNCLAKPDEFRKIPGSPLAYWASENVFQAYANSELIKEKLNPKQGMATGDNESFLRYWWEVNFEDVSLFSKNKEELWAQGKKYARYNKGGEYRKWYGNNEILIRFTKEAYEKLKSQGNHCPSENLYFRRSLTWSDITTKAFAARLSPEGAVFDVKGSSGFPSEKDEYALLGLLCSNFINYMMGMLNPSITFQVGDLSRVPFIDSDWSDVTALSKKAVEITKSNYDQNETSYDFQELRVVSRKSKFIEDSFNEEISHLESMSKSLCVIEENINRSINSKYGLESEVPSSCSSNDLTLEFNPQVQKQSDFRCFLMRCFVSYSIGCMMGRYTLDKPGLLNARKGESSFHTFIQSSESTFFTYEDGIVPITDQEWFSFDATNRICELVGYIWGEEHLQRNLDYIAECLCMNFMKVKIDESALDTIRRYLSTQFYKDHMRTYKKRPIYWLFSSGKLKAFECLVYLHRYNEGTLSRMRMEYVVPLQSRHQARIEDLDNSLFGDVTTSERKRLQKEQDQLRKKLDELRRFDEQLRHFADQRIKLNLDDGVKVNYGRFGDLLADVKAITGN